MIDRNKLDTLFLSVTVSFGIMEFNFVYNALHGYTRIIDSVPFFFASISLPLFVGYYGGAVCDSLVNRLRGWTMLAVADFVMVGIVVDSATGVNAIEYALAIAGLVVGGMLGLRLSRVLGIPMTWNVFLALITSAGTAYLLPIVLVLIESMIAIQYIGGVTLNFALIQFAIGFGALLVFLFIVVLEKIRDAFSNYEAELEEFDVATRTRFQTNFRRSPIFTLLSVIGKTFFRNKWAVGFLCGTFLFLFLSYGMLELHASISLIFLGLYGTDILLACSIISFARISKHQLVIDAMVG